MNSYLRRLGLDLASTNFSRRGSPHRSAGIAVTKLLDELELTVAPYLEEADATRILIRVGVDWIVCFALCDVLEIDGFLFLQHDKRLAKFLVCDVKGIGRADEGISSSGSTDPSSARYG